MSKHQSSLTAMSHQHTICLTVLALAIGAGGLATAARAQDSDDQAMPASMSVPLERSRQAIAECRERRLKHELPTYLASAQCSSRQIFAAWRAAKYPHMDLITEWLNAREALSAKVDQKTMTERQFDEQMAALSHRLTLEERRRRAGFVTTPDSSLELQLPSSTQVIGVATPPGQEKLAKRKTAAAVAASRMPETSGNGVQSLASLSTLDGDKPKAATGTGGPFVPVPGTTGSGPLPQGGSGLYAHVASQHSEADARAALQTLRQQYPAILGNRDAVIRRADVAGQGTYYRVEIGPLSNGQADQLCGSLRAAGAQCVTQFE